MAGQEAPAPAVVLALGSAQRPGQHLAPGTQDQEVGAASASPTLAALHARYT